MTPPNSRQERRARAAVSAYLKRLGVHDRQHLRRHVEKAIDAARDSADPGYDLPALAVRHTMADAVEWCDEVALHLGLKAGEEETRGFILLELRRVLANRPDLLFVVNEDLLADLRPAVLEMLAMFPRNNDRLEMPGQRLEDLAGVFQLEAWAGLLVQDVASGRIFRSRSRR